MSFKIDKKLSDNFMELSNMWAEQEQRFMVFYGSLAEQAGLFDKQHRPSFSRVMNPRVDVLSVTMLFIRDQLWATIIATIDTKDGGLHINMDGHLSDWALEFFDGDPTKDKPWVTRRLDR